MGMPVMKNLWAVAVAAFLLPQPVAAEEPVMKLAGMLRCAAVYQVTSKSFADGSAEKLAASRHFLQYYMIMLAMAENGATDDFDAKTLGTLFEAQRAAADSDAIIARAEGRPNVFAADIATCAAFRERQPKLFATADETIDVLAKAQTKAQ